MPRTFCASTRRHLALRHWLIVLELSRMISSRHSTALVVEMSSEAVLQVHCWTTLASRLAFCAACYYYGAYDSYELAEAGRRALHGQQLRARDPLHLLVAAPLFVDHAAMSLRGSAPPGSASPARAPGTPAPRRSRPSASSPRCTPAAPPPRTSPPAATSPPLAPT